MWYEKNLTAFAGFEDGGGRSVAKECGQHLEAGKDKEWILPSAYRKECSTPNLLMLAWWDICQISDKCIVVICYGSRQQEKTNISNKHCSTKMGKGNEQAEW